MVNEGLRLGMILRSVEGLVEHFFHEG